MTDNTELKRLAEAFPADLDWDSNTEPFFNGPSGESLGGGSTGFYSVYGKPFRLEGENYDGPTYVEACHADFAKFMVAAREGVLALIAENERLAAKIEQVRSRSVSLDYSKDAVIPNALDAWGRVVPQHLPYDFSGNPGASATQYCNGWNDAGGYWKAHCVDIQSERDQLKTENERLHKLVSWQGDANNEVTISAGQLMKHMDERDQLKAESDRLKAEVDSLTREADRQYTTIEAYRKGAERYQWLRDSSESIHQFYLSTPIWFTGVKFSKENVDSTIDAAMGKGEQS
ncbi:hypothetical protein [Pseudomonas sp. NPDC087626]|uniref:hypothetical protein n=1 Tax=Pseudomonas sp. NPDC087626 TaxID=3364444 RepID=UPI00380445B5